MGNQLDSLINKEQGVQEIWNNNRNAKNTDNFSMSEHNMASH